MGYTILGEFREIKRPDGLLRYRGLERSNVINSFTPGESHPSRVNGAYERYLAAWDRNECNIVFDDFALVYETFVTFSASFPELDYAIYEITRWDDKPAKSGTFWGYDVIYGIDNSFIMTFLPLSVVPIGGFPNNLCPQDEDFSDAPLAGVIAQFFGKQLNSYGLFSDYAAACWCLSCFRASHKTRDHYWVCNEDMNDTRIVGIHRISDFENVLDG